ncbi:unnamed protein product [Heterobilharzia americana]|nr:unnamed protein product [Heterobilharzia americana]
MSLFKGMNWTNLMKKFHEITHYQFSSFHLTWNDINDILRALEYVQDRELVDDCLHVSVSAIPKSLSSTDSVCCNPCSANKPVYSPYPPTYAEATESQGSLSSETTRKQTRKSSIIAG